MGAEQPFFELTDTDYPVFKIFFSKTEPGQRRLRVEHHHSECEISLIVSGQCQWCVNDRTFLGHKGDVYLFGSNENHYLLDVIGTEPLLLLNIRFDSRFIWSPGGNRFNLRYLEIFLNHPLSFSNAISHTEPVASSVCQLMMEIYQEFQNQEPEYQLVVKAKLLLILAALGRYYDVSAQSSVPHTYRHHLNQLDNAITYINANLTTNLNLEAIAREAGMSRSYFSTVFKRMNGIPVWDYITRKRIELAMALLREQDLSVLEVAEECGFSSISNFNRCFRQVTGISPSAYRKEFSSHGLI